ncbi:hypothetical protein K474DRAFT_625247 [Panus rudis PR-1116 ss-1]|nr:hypothetical protein K474DRAFT_625247 [Panus rudis PR-1116 ss-1]
MTHTHLSLRDYVVRRTCRSNRLPMERPLRDWFINNMYVVARSFQDKPGNVIFGTRKEGMCSTRDATRVVHERLILSKMTFLRSQQGRGGYSPPRIGEIVPDSALSLAISSLHPVRGGDPAIGYCAVFTTSREYSMVWRKETSRGANEDWLHRRSWDAENTETYHKPNSRTGNECSCNRIFCCQMLYF